MKKIVVCLVLGHCLIFLNATETSSLNVRVPGGLEPKEIVFGIHHRFLGKINDDPVGSAFGLNVGANVSASLRGRVWSNLEMNGAYTRTKKEYTLGAGYILPDMFAIRSELAVQYFDYEEPSMSERRRNFFYQALLQSHPILNHVALAGNVGYDAYNLRWGASGGADCGFDIELGPFQGIHIIGEYFPVFNGNSTVTGPKNSFAAGIKLDTYGHHFMFLVSNNTVIGIRRLMLGAPANDLYFGFNIHRFLK